MITENTTAEQIHSWIEWQIRERLRGKYRWRPSKGGPRKMIRRNLNIIGYHLVGLEYPGENSAKPSVNLGVDQFGRDVAGGIRLYSDIVRKRGVDIRTLVVLGSRAKGTWNRRSDVDLLIVAGAKPSKRQLRDYPLFLGIEVTGCSDSEFLRWLNECRIIALDAMYYGVLFSDDGFWNQAKEAFELIKRKYDLPWDQIRTKMLPL